MLLFNLIMSPYWPTPHLPEPGATTAAGRGARIPVAVLGVLKAGCGYVPVDPDYPEARRRYILDVGAAVLAVATLGSMAMTTNHKIDAALARASPAPRSSSPTAT